MKLKDLSLYPASYINKPIALGIGSLENHGVLPIGSDLLIANCILDHLHDVVIAPPITYTTSYEHTHRGYTINTNYKVFLDYAAAVLRGLSSLTTRGILVVVFHGGAIHAIRNAARRVRVEVGARILVYDFWSMISSFIQEMGVKPGPIHGGVIEASILHYCGYNVGGNLVDFNKAMTLVTSEAKVKNIAEDVPWIALDNEYIYDTEKPPVSPELGQKLVKHVVGVLNKALQRL